VVGLEQRVSIEVGGAVQLEGRLGLVQTGRAGLVLCHPHPLYGGDMDNPVVVRAAEVAREEGVGTLRFNFRGVGASTGVHAHGEGERMDLRAAMALLRSHVAPDGPFGLLGYSFGAWIAAGVAGSESTLAALALVAPPLAMLDFTAPPAAGPDVLLVAGTRDTYCPVPVLEEMAGRTEGARTVIVEGADHFFFGKLFPLGEAIREWARRWARR
jgi:alpha/beta superfamily hydrolase